MANEKMKILKLLEEGRITASEAARLLEVSGKTETSVGDINNKERNATQTQQDYKTHHTSFGNENKRHNTQYNSTNSERYTSKEDSTREEHANTNNGTYRSDAPNMDNFAEELSRKFEVFVKDFEPKIQKFTEVVMEKTVNAAEKISKTLTTPPSYPQRDTRPAEHPHSQASSGMGRGYEKNIELRVEMGNNEFIASGLNAPVLLKGYNGDKISAKLYCVPKRNDAKIELSVLGSKYFLDYNEEDFDRVAIDAFIPENLFKHINISNYNGDVNLATLNSGFINLYVSNGAVTLNQIYSENLKVECENGREMKISNIFSDNALIENYNGDIIANNLEIENLKMTSFNGAFNMNVSNFNKYNNYAWIIEASNQRLNVNLPTFSDVGYHIKAKTSLGDVKVGLTGLNYIFNTPNIVEAKTIDYNSLPKKVNISLETSNAQLVVN